MCKTVLQRPVVGLADIFRILNRVSNLHCQHNGALNVGLDSLPALNYGLSAVCSAGIVANGVCADVMASLVGRVQLVVATIVLHLAFEFVLWSSYTLKVLTACLSSFLLETMC